MDLIFRGMLFVLLDFNLELGDASIGLIPDWLGYWWLAQGFLEMEKEWDGFGKLRTPALVLAAVSGAAYVLDLMALSAQMAVLNWVLWLCLAVGGLYVAQRIGAGVRHMERHLGRELQGEKLQNLWIFLAALNIIGALFSWVPLVGPVCAVAAIIVDICWMSALNGSRKEYKAM